MVFSSRRGRPVKQKDRYSPTIRKKSKEILDILRDNNYIDEDLLGTALHLRWLYSLCFGIPDYGANWGILGDLHHNRDDSEEWRKDREKEYFTAMELLEAEGLSGEILSLCVFNERPKNNIVLQRQILALNILNEFWKNNKKR